MSWEDKPRCHNCKSFTERKYVKSDTDTFGRWCDGYCSKDKQYTWFFNTCKEHKYDTKQRANKETEL